MHTAFSVIVSGTKVQGEFLGRLVVGTQGKGVDFGLVIDIVACRTILALKFTRSAMVPADAHLVLRFLPVEIVGHGQVEFIQWRPPD